MSDIGNNHSQVNTCQSDFSNHDKIRIEEEIAQDVSATDTVNKGVVNKDKKRMKTRT